MTNINLTKPEAKRPWYAGGDKTWTATPSKTTPDHATVTLMDAEHFGEIELDFSRSEVAQMVGCFPDYMPTMDAVHRFMKSNPLTSAEMLVELQPSLFAKTVRAEGDQ